MNSACAFAPATIANLNVGFDVLGMALGNIGDTVEVSFNNTTENRIIEIINGAGLPLQSEKNCCSVVIRKMQESNSSFKGVDIRIRKGFPSGSGLGSSSASSAAAAFAYNELIGSPFSLNELVFFAGEGERVACGSAHFDNVAPAILGGLVLIRKQKLLKLPIPNGVHLVSFFPKVEVKTADSRSALSSTVPLKTASDQIASMAGFISSLYENDLDRFSESLVDLMIEPQRKSFIPKFDEMKACAMKNGALAFGISGSGPSVFAFGRSSSDVEKIESELQSIFIDTQIEIQSFTESVNDTRGAYLTTFS